MSNYTRDDLTIILRFGVHVAKVDNELAPWEKRVLRRLVDTMGLTDDEKAQMVDEGLHLAEGLKRLSGPDARRLLIKALCAIASSDGHVVETEREFIHNVVESLGDQAFVLPSAEWGQYEEEVVQAFQGGD